jgi:hypothetical protein
MAQLFLNDEPLLPLQSNYSFVTLGSHYGLVPIHVALTPGCAILVQVRVVVITGVTQTYETTNSLPFSG